MKININDPIPLYYQIEEVIRKKIINNYWQPGELIPSERILSCEFNVSRMTIRQALNELVLDGWLRREKGIGTFVKIPKLTQQLGRLAGFSQDMAVLGKSVTSKVIQIERNPANDEVTKALHIDKGQLVTVLKRLRIVEGVTAALEICYLNFHGAEKLLEIDMSQSLYNLLASDFGIIPTRATQKLEASKPTTQEAILMDISTDEPSLRMERTTYDQNGQPFEFTLSIYRGNYYKFNIELTI